MTLEQSKIEGRKLIYMNSLSLLGILVLAGVIIAQWDRDTSELFVEMNDVFQHITYGVILLVFFNYWIGGFIGRKFFFNHWNPFVLGILYFYTTIIICVLTGTVTEMLLIRQYSVFNDLNRLFEDYVYKPLAISFIVAILPSLILGVVTGFLLIRRRKSIRRAEFQMN